MLSGWQWVDALGSYFHELVSTKPQTPIQWQWGISNNGDVMVDPMRGTIIPYNSVGCV